MEGLGGILFGWVFLSFVCGFVLSGKKSGFWGTFFLCLLLSPLLGVIISVASGNKEIRQTKKENKSVEKEKLLKQIENLKKEEELDLISEDGKIKLDELTTLYKNYDEWHSQQQKNKIVELEKQEEINRKMRSRLAIILFILFGLLALATIISSFA